MRLEHIHKRECPSIDFTLVYGPGAGGQIHSLFHIWWSCQKALRFWTRVYSLIRWILNALLACNPGKPCYISRSPYLTKAQRRLIGFVFLAAQQMLEKTWRQPYPNISEVKQWLMGIMVHEKLISILTTPCQILEDLGPMDNLIITRMAILVLCSGLDCTGKFPHPSPFSGKSLPPISPFSLLRCPLRAFLFSL